MRKIDYMRAMQDIVLTKITWRDTAAGQQHWGRVFHAICEGIRREEMRERSQP